MVIEKDVLDRLLAGRDPNDVFAKNGLVDELKKALANRVLSAEMDFASARQSSSPLPSAIVSMKPSRWREPAWPFYTPWAASVPPARRATRQAGSKRNGIGLPLTPRHPQREELSLSISPQFFLCTNG